MKIVGNRSGSHYAKAYLPTSAQANLEKQYMASAESQRIEALAGYGATSRGPEQRSQQEQPPPLAPARPGCPLPRTLANTCSYPRITYRCPAGSTRPCVPPSFQGAYLPYSVSYEDLWRKSVAIAKTLYQGTPYTSFVKRVDNGAPKQFNKDFM